MRQPTVSLSYQTLQGTLETITIQPLPLRPLAELPILFWLHLGAGVVSLVLAAWVALQRSSDPAGRIAFAMACAGLWLVTHGAALYATRELALNVAQFKTASAINYIGSFVGGIGLVNLFLVCPTRIARPWQLWIALLLIVPIALLSLANLDGFEVSRQVTVMILVLAFVALVIVQTIKCWRDPVARAVMTWLGIAVIICSVVYVVAIIIPALTGQDQKITQGPALVIILVFYIALGVAVARYRLYALPDLSMRLLFYVGGLVPLLLLDAGLIYLLSFEAAPALGLSLALVGLFYLPLRARMFTWFGRNKTPPPEEVFKRINEVVLATDHIARRGAFEALFQWLFAPMQIRAAPAPVANAQLIGNGEALDIQGPAGLGDLRLAWARNGRGLFSGQDLKQTQSILGTLQDLLARHQKYDSAISEERSRINRDVHDNIGILLSSALHTNEVERKDILIRQTLKDMREIIVNPVDEPKQLLDLVADLRGEVSELFEAADIKLAWDDKGLSEMTLNPANVHTLRALCREAANNILKHSKAKSANFDLSMRNAKLSVEISDTGIRMGAHVTLGNGIENLRNQVTSTGGSFAISSPRLRTH